MRVTVFQGVVLLGAVWALACGPAQEPAATLTKPAAADSPSVKKTSARSSAAPEREKSSVEIWSLPTSPAGIKQKLQKALNAELDRLRECASGASGWRGVFDARVSLRISRAGAVERVSFSPRRDGPVEECMETVMKEMVFAGFKRYVSPSFQLQIVPSSISREDLAVLDECDDVYRICMERLYVYYVPKHEVVRALLQNHLGGACNRAQKPERYRVNARLNADTGLDNVRVRISSGRSETRACLENEIKRTQIDGAWITRSSSISFTLKLEPASPLAYDGAPAHVSLGRPDVHGGLSWSIIRRYTRKALPQLNTCYDRALQANPKASGRAQASTRIGKDGKVVSAAVTGLPASLGECVKTVMAGIEYPRPRTSDPSVEVRYPMTFVPAKQLVPR